MIGWKVACIIDIKEVIAEVASQPYSYIDDGYSDGIGLMVYHDGLLKQIHYKENEPLKVIERK
jgi:hypothetical protein